MLRGLLAAAALVAAVPAPGAEPPVEPILRIETGMHAATVRRLIVDPARNRLITTGDDKALRVWQLPDGKLANVLRFPIGTGHEGRIFAMAVSPDGSTIAAGGWTGWDWDKQGAIYLFDAETGDLRRRVSGLPETIGFLAYSKDGKHLAVGLQGTAGLRVLRTSDYAVETTDTQYADKILGADFAPNGRLAVAALDGLVRIYDPQLKLIGRKRVGPGTKPLIVKHSPDGSRLAVSFHDIPALAVYSTTDLSLMYSTDPAPIKQQTRMADLAWSTDGEYLYGCGDYSGPGQNPIYRWSRAGQGAVERILVANQRISDLQSLPGGGVAFTAEDPVIGTLDASGKRTLYIGSELADFRDAGNTFRLSDDGSAVEFPTEAGGKKVARFALFEKSLGAGRGEGAPRGTDGFRVQNWKDRTDPEINGVKLALDDYEVSRSYAVSPDRQTLVLGSEWALRGYGRDAKVLWKTEAPGVVWNVAVTGDGRSVVATLGDGTLRWYRLEDGVEYLALFPHGAGEEWIAWVPQGYYVSSNYGDNFVGWQLNRGKERAPDFFRAVQLERVLYRPDVVEAHFRTRGRDSGGAAKRAAQDFDIRDLAKIAPPRIRVTRMAPAKAPDGAARLRIAFTVERNSLPMQDYALYVNNIPVTAARERALSGADALGFSREAEIDITGRETLVRIEVGNGKSVGLAERVYGLPSAAITRARPGELYMVSIGVNQFVNIKGANLGGAARDAEEMEKFFRTHAAGNFSRVRSLVVTDNTADKPVRARVLEALRFIENAGPRDTVVIFLASHGLSDPAGQYYFVPRDATSEDVDTVLRGEDKPVTSLVPWSHFFDALRRVAGRRVLIVDTCHAKDIQGKLDVHSLAKRSASSLFSLVVAAKGDEESQEYAPAKQGLFTWSFLDGLQGKSDANADGYVTLAEAFGYAAQLVEKLRDRRAGPQTPQILAPEPLGGVVLARSASAAAAAPTPQVENVSCGARSLVVGKKDPRC